MKKWEYYVISGVYFGLRGIQAGKHTAFHHFTPQGEEFQSWEKTSFNTSYSSGIDPEKEIARRIAQLGLEGWEMVNAYVSPGRTNDTLVFKRPIE